MTKQQDIVTEFSFETKLYIKIAKAVEWARGWQLGDCVIRSSGSMIKKWQITYIEPQYGLVYGRALLRSNTLGKDIINLTDGWQHYVIDPDQVEAMLLGQEYDPWESIREYDKEMKALRSALRQERFNISNNASDKELMDIFKPHKYVWMIPKHVQLQELVGVKCEITFVGPNAIELIALDTQKTFWRSWDIVRGYQIFFKEPVLAEQICDLIKSKQR